MKIKERGCGDCKYYLAHFAKMDGRLFEVYCGHCYYPRIKKREPDTKPCKYFVDKTSESEEL